MIVIKGDGFGCMVPSCSPPLPGEGGRPIQFRRKWLNPFLLFTLIRWEASCEGREGGRDGGREGGRGGMEGEEEEEGRKEGEEEEDRRLEG